MEKGRLSLQESKFLRSLRLKKYRQENNLFLIEGKNLCAEALNADCSMECIIYDPSREMEFSSLLHQAAEKKIPLKTASNRVLKQISTTTSPPGIAACVRWKNPEFSAASTAVFDRLLVLDEVRDPGNLGTLIRTAEWFGIDGILCGEKSLEVINPKVVRGSMGALFRQKIWENVPLAAVLPELVRNGFELIGTDLHAKKAITRAELAEFASLSKAALILGNEAHGIRSEILSLCSHRIAIPGTGSSDSLNVAVAGSILMYSMAKL